MEIVKRLMLAYPEGPLFRNSDGEPWTADSVNCAFTRIRVRMGRRLLKATRIAKDKRRKLLYIDEQSVTALALAATIRREQRVGKPKSHTN